MTKPAHAGDCLREWLAVAQYNQSDLAEMLEVSRAAVSKWVSGHAVPSEEHAKQIEQLSRVAVPTTLWPRRKLPPPPSKGARVLQKAAQLYNNSILAMADATGLPQRALARWAAGQNGPRANSLAQINAVLKTNLRVEDFQVTA